MNNYTAFLNRGKAKYGDKFDSSDLDQYFVKYYESGERIKVKLNMGNEIYYECGTVSVTTGWKPVFILKHKRN